ncbi:MAG: AAA family ATPase [Luteimonas sp.]|nr:AAA family ATPase [Luteimonas sp.]
MKTIAIAAQKGGAGKTTLAVHLAVEAFKAGERAFIVDTDPQGSAAAWARTRNQGDPAVIAIPIDRLDDVLAAGRYDAMTLCIVDTPPHATAGAATVARSADLVVIPVRPSAFDLAAAEASIAIARQSRQVVVMLSSCPTRAPEIAESRVVLQRYGIPVLDAELTERRAFARAVASGRAVSEFEPAGRAAAEISAVWNELKGRLA